MTRCLGLPALCFSIWAANFDDYLFHFDSYLNMCLAVTTEIFQESHDQGLLTVPEIGTSLLFLEMARTRLTWRLILVCCLHLCGKSWAKAK